LNSPEEVDAVEIERQPLRNNLEHETGPFDIIGDVHGCREELDELLIKLGYTLKAEDIGDLPAVTVQPPEGRKAIFLGDLVDRGPDAPGVLRLVMGMVERGTALCLPGNHDMKLLRKLRGRDVKLTHGLAETVEQLERETPEFRASVEKFLDSLIGHYVLDGGRLVAAHAGMKEVFQGRASGRVRDFALYGETTGETDEFGLPVRHNWAGEYRGSAIVVYGHTPVPEPEWLNRTINIDTGCAFGGRLTALRYPEKELVSVAARRVYSEPVRPFLPETPAAPEPTAQQRHDELLDLEDVVGKRIISTRLFRNITIREENAITALEAMSRFAADPRWLIYLPPTMSPSETTHRPGLLEHPAEAFADYRREGVGKVICEEKHMGSRAVVIVCRDAAAARARFGVSGDEIGICYTRTGRRFFEDAELESVFLDRIRSAVDVSGLWDKLNTTWICLDCELMPWSAKAQGLLRDQYAAVGSAAHAGLSAAVRALEAASNRPGAGGEPPGETASDLLDRYKDRAFLAERYVEAYRRYCWPVSSLTDLKLAPFHLLASEGAVHTDRDHTWHMETLADLCRADAEDRLLLATPYGIVDLDQPESEAEGIRWWEALTARGGEGMVVKPLSFIAPGRRGIAQPAIKCRGPEYLRIIYGPEYTVPENLERLRSRGVSAKRSLAIREFALGVEGLERFVQGEPLRRVHECVFGVLAMESEPVDPRL
ncbi:MAG TPA: polynucleotide kinase-phosphatase, partial [Armatimonadota bacterium]|nr:polynucleotide kinase-phosphatase [Armatimonadota bacterium]